MEDEAERKVFISVIRATPDNLAGTYQLRDVRKSEKLRTFRKNQGRAAIQAVLLHRDLEGNLFTVVHHASWTKALNKWKQLALLAE